MKKVLALVLAAMMVLALVGSALADTASIHKITINNGDQYVSHSYKAYQVFVGNADSTKNKLANIDWGNGVNGAAIITALKASTCPSSLSALSTAVASVDTTDAAAVKAAARTIAETLGASFSSTNTAATTSAGALDDFAAIVAANVVAANGVDLTETSAGKVYEGNVTGDGYYIVIDDTAKNALTDSTTLGSDTTSKHILIPVFADATANAKDTHIQPDKEILKANGASFDRVKEGTAAIGDEVKFEVSIPVPNTAKYQKGFTFEMNDTLPAGMTFKQLDSVKVNSDDVPNVLTVYEADGTTAFAPAPGADLVTTTGGQKIHIDFKDASHDFKYYSEDKGWYGSNLVVTYTAVVNKDANLTPTGNLNEVSFDYSNDPNHAYDGTETNPPMGTTPKDKTKTVLANIVILKTDGAGAPLAGAEFEIESASYNMTLLTGEKFEVKPYSAEANETVEAGTTYYKLTDGTYTTTPYSTENSSYYVDNTEYVKVSFTKTVTDGHTTGKITVVSGEDGYIKLEGVKPGTYTIKETKAPLGYNLDPNTHTIEIEGTYSTSTKTITLSGTVDGSATGWNGTTATASITIVNNTGTTLPSTGGIGTTIFYVSGLLMVLGASIILVARRRADAE